MNGCAAHGLSLEQTYYVTAIVGVIGLFWYVIETYRLRKISQRQLESLAKPCVLILEDADEIRNFADRNLIIKNVGNGPALNIRWRLSAWQEWSSAPALSPGGFIRPPLKPKEVDDGGGGECTFVSLGGKRYRSQSKYIRIPPSNTILLEHGFEELRNS